MRHIFTECIVFLLLLHFEAMLLRLSRPYSYDPRPISKKLKKSEILISRRVYPKCKKQEKDK